MNSMLNCDFLSIGLKSGVENGANLVLVNEVNTEIGLLTSSLCNYQGISTYFTDMKKSQ